MLKRRNRTPRRHLSEETDWDYEEGPVGSKRHRSNLKRHDGHEQARIYHPEYKSLLVDARIEFQEQELELMRSFLKNEMQSQRAELEEHHRDLHFKINRLSHDVGLLTTGVERISSQLENKPPPREWCAQSSLVGGMDQSQSAQHESRPSQSIAIDLVDAKRLTCSQEFPPPVTIEDEQNIHEMQSSDRESHSVFGAEEIEDPITDNVPELKLDSRSGREIPNEDDPSESTDPGVEITDLQLEIYEDRTSAEVGYPAVVGNPYIMSDREADLRESWTDIRDSIPTSKTVDFRYDTVYGTSGEHGAWTCTPMEGDKYDYPLQIARAPVVIPVQHQWPPIAGVAAPSDPRGTRLIDCRADLSIETIRDIFTTFEGCIGAYLLVNGYLQVVVPDDFDMGSAASHYPHQFGGLKVSYIRDTRMPTMDSNVSNSIEEISSHNASTKIPIIAPGGQKPRSPGHADTYSLHLNDIIEARSTWSSKLGRKVKVSGRIGLQIKKNEELYFIMSTHVITQAMTYKNPFSAIFSRGQLPVDWLKRVKVFIRKKKVRDSILINISKVS